MSIKLSASVWSLNSIPRALSSTTLKGSSCLQGPYIVYLEPKSHITAAPFHTNVSCYFSDLDISRTLRSFGQSPQHWYGLRMQSASHAMPRGTWGAPWGRRWRRGCPKKRPVRGCRPWSGRCTPSTARMEMVQGPLSKAAAGKS